MADGVKKRLAMREQVTYSQRRIKDGGVASHQLQLLLRAARMLRKRMR